MRLSQLSTCIIAYYGALVLFGMIGTLLAPATVDHGLGHVLGGGLRILFLTHIFFISAIAIQQDWISHVMVVGVPIALILVVIRLTGWLRNLAVVGLLFAAHAYGFAVAGING